MKRKHPLPAKEQIVDPVRVIRYPADGSLDYYLPRQRARQLFDAGKIALDLTNGCYTTYEAEMGNSSGPIIR